MNSGAYREKHAPNALPHLAHLLTIKDRKTAVSFSSTIKNWSGVKNEQRVYTERIIEKKMTFAVGLAGPLSSPRRAIFQLLRQIH